MDHFLTYERQALRSVTRSRKPGTHIVLVDVRNSDWRPDWVEKALESVSGFKPEIEQSDLYLSVLRLMHGRD